MKKTVSVLLLLVMLLFSLTACNFIHKRITPADVEKRVIEEATKYLKENYPDDEFTFKSAADPNWSDKYWKIGFITKKYDNQELTVYAESTEEESKDGFTKYKYVDNYYQYYMNDDAEKFFYDIAEKYFRKNDNIVIKVAFETSKTDAECIPVNSSFDEELDNLDMTIYMFTEDKKVYDKDDKMRRIVKELDDKNMLVYIFYIYTDKIEEVKNMKFDDIELEEYSIKFKSFDTFSDKVNEEDKKS